MSQKETYRFKYSKEASPDVRSAVEARRLQPLMAALRAVRSTTIPDPADREELERQRKGQQLLGQLVAPRLGIRWEPFQIDEIPASWAKPEPGHNRKNAILYCHGGGYTSGNLGYARVLGSKLAFVTGYETLCFEYRLAPEHPYPAAIEDAVKAWDHLMYQGYGARDVVLCGDSAGGNMALVLALTLREMGRHMPKALVLLSPWTDMTASGVSYTEEAETDPVITLDYIKAVRQAYAGEQDLSSPYLSPLFGDFSSFPPTLIQVGSNEILRSDSIRLRDRLISQGIPCRLEVWNNLWHVFQMFPTRKAGEAMEHIGKFLLELF